MGTELAPETSENLHIFMRLSARENFIEFCRRESFETSREESLHLHGRFEILNFYKYSFVYYLFIYVYNYAGSRINKYLAKLQKLRRVHIKFKMAYRTVLVI
jgi:hypothetical protein